MIQPGMKLQNRYEILHELGRGGMGAVFKAHDPLLDREVAIKTLSSALSADDSFIQRFQHEARAIARLNHPGIVGIFDVGYDKGVSFIVMEYIVNGSLEDLLKRQSPLPPLRVVELLEQIAVALDFAHSRGFVHRDIKPANILLDEEGKTRLTDFGLVKMENVNLTMPGQVMGTPTYMAPEQIVGEEVNAAADIYSLGVVAYEMLAGSPPFSGAMTSIFDGHVRREPPALRQLNPNLPDGLEPILRRVLAKDPPERFATAAAFANSLRQLFASTHPATIAAPPAFAAAAGSGVPAAPGRPPAAAAPSAASAPPEPPKKKGVNLFVLVGGLAAALFLCFCLALMLLSWGGSGGGEPTAVAQPTQLPTAVPDDSTPPPDDEADPPDPAVDDGRIASLEDARRAVVQIEAQGSFVDPQFGLQLNQAGRGSGFVIDSSGLAVTNNHVVTGAALLRVYVDGESRPRSARVLGVSECYDLAVIQIDGEPLPAFSWYEERPVAGQSAHAAGFPLGAPDYSLTSGLILSADADGVTDWAALDFVLSHSAAIQPGNSGGPLLADDGRIIGVNYALSSGRDEYFAIGRQQALPIIEQLAQGQDVFAIGINGVAVNDGGDIVGIWVSSVKAGSPADQAGVLPGDLITTMQGLLLAQDGTMGDYCGVLRSHGQNDVLSIEVLRLDTDEILAGQINGRALETKSLLSNLDQTVGEGGLLYEDYVSFTDQEEFIRVDIPAVWNDIGQGAWTRDGEAVGSYIVASADLDGFYDRWDEPGLFLGASRVLMTQYDENSLLDSFVYTNSCDYDDRYEYSDPLYTGYYDLWIRCDGGDTVFFVMAVSPEDRSFLILAQVILVTDADIEALEYILDSFIISTSLP